MTTDTLERTKASPKDHEDTREAPARYTVTWGWFAAPRFGAAGSGGLEYEDVPVRRKAD
jgi:hypothetical protein